MSCSSATGFVKRRAATEFNPEWERDYLFTEVSAGAQCLLCGKIISIKKFNVARHYKNTHADQYGDIEGEDRIALLEKLKDQKPPLFYVAHRPSCSTDFEEQIILDQPKKRKRPAPAEEATPERPTPAEEATPECKEEYTNAITNIAEIKEFEAIGINVAKKLQRMDPTQALYAESIINAVLRRGLLNTLRDCTDLCDNHCNTLARVLNSRSSSPPPLLVTDVTQLSDNQGQS